MFGNITTRYILKDLLQVFFFTLFILTLVFFIIFSGRIVDKYSQYISLIDIIVLAPYTLALTISFTMPLAMLAATTMVYGRMAYEKELLVLRIAGVHFRKIFRPAFALGAVLSIICFYINANIVPHTFIKQKQLKYKALDLVISASFSSEETTISFIPEVQIYYRKLENGKFHYLIIQRTSKRLVTEEIFAKSGNILYDKEQQILTFQLKNCTINHIQRKQKPGIPFYKTTEEHRFFFKTFSVPIDLKTKKRNFSTDHPRYKMFQDLYEDIKKYRIQFEQLDRLIKKTKNPSLGLTGRRDDALENYRYHTMEFHRRIVSSLTTLLIVFLGAPLGILIRHNNRLVSFGVGALPVILLYYPLQIIGRAMGKKAILSPFWAEWSATLVTLLLGIGILTWVYRK